MPMEADACQCDECQMSLEDAHAEGYQAYDKGMSMIRNPYCGANYDKACRRAWNMGWNKAALEKSMKQ